MPNSSLLCSGIRWLERFVLWYATGSFYHATGIRLYGETDFPVLWAIRIVAFATILNLPVIVN